MTGVCGTDLHLHVGEFGPVFPLTPGHEIVGEVLALGSGTYGLQVGQTVAVACAVHGADVLALPPGADVLVFGAGPTGLVLAQLLARGGAARLTVAAPTAFKLELARGYGADETVQVSRADPAAAVARLRELAPAGFDAVFRRELTIKGSFAQAFSFDRALALLRSGRVRTEGIVTDRYPIECYGDALDGLRDPACLKGVVVP